MATLQFEIHTDKENATCTGIRKPGGSIQGSISKKLQTFKTPRRALGSVNEANHLRGTQTHHDWKSGSLSVRAKDISTEKDLKLKLRFQVDKENGVVEKCKLQGGSNVQSCGKPKQQQPPLSLCLPEVEYMPPPSPPRDEDEDILPKKERASTYVHRLLSWRPPCLFGTQPDSDEEEEENREFQRIMDELDNLPLPSDNHNDLFPGDSRQPVCEEIDVNSIKLPTMEDIPLPYIDDDNQGLSFDIPLPSLDDSVGGVPHLEALQILD